MSKLNKTQKEGIVKALKKSKSYLAMNQNDRWDRYKPTHICDAISEAVYDEKITDDEARDAQTHIHRQLGSQVSSVQEWLMVKGYITEEEHENLFSEASPKIQKYRKAWMNKMIADLS